MATAMAVRGTIPEMIRNDGGLYQGDLIAYFQIVFNHARNLRHPYHNFRHMLHVTHLCYQACVFYHDLIPQRIMRNLLIAALIHDFDHSGMLGDDDLNIQRATRGLEKHFLPEDRVYVDEIAYLIRVTQYPRPKNLDDPDFLPAQIICDADQAQALDPAWIQQAIFGLAAEAGKDPIEILREQAPFLLGLKFQTAWAREKFPQSEIDAKIREAQELLDILEP